MHYQRKPGFSSTYLDSDLCIFDQNNYNYINFNSTGTEIWNILEKPKTISEITSKLIMIYNIDFEKCFPEVESFLKDGVKQGLIEIV